jgi:hypothetical protein
MLKDIGRPNVVGDDDSDDNGDDTANNSVHMQELRCFGPHEPNMAAQTWHCGSDCTYMVYMASSLKSSSLLAGSLSSVATGNSQVSLSA